MAFKIDIHNHILPERWPDLKEVSITEYLKIAAKFRDVSLLRTELSLSNGLESVIALRSKFPLLGSCK